MVVRLRFLVDLRLLFLVDPRLRSLVVDQGSLGDRMSMIGMSVVINTNLKEMNVDLKEMNADMKDMSVDMKVGKALK